MSYQLAVAVPRGAPDELVDMVVAVDKEKPKPRDIENLRQYLVEHPDMCDHLGNLANLLRSDLTRKSFAAVPVATGIETYCEHLRDELEYDDASQMEKMLIDHILVCWVRLYDTELRYEMARKDNPTINQMDHWERRLTLAQHRYLRAIESLAKVRRLLKDPPKPTSPALAILMKQQLNVGR